MSLLKKIYLSPAGYIISFLQNFAALFTRPFMVYGYYDRCSKRFFRNTRISSTASILEPGKLKIGDQCWVWHHSILDASNGISIGDGVQIGAYVGIFTHSSHVSIRLLGADFIKVAADDRIGYVRAPVSIGDYTFIAAGAVIMPGASIGKGCIIAAGSVVKGEIPDFSVVAGNPAKIIGNTGSFDKRYIHSPGIEFTYFDFEHLEFLRGVSSADPDSK